MKLCSFATQTTRHASGLRTLPTGTYAVPVALRHHVELPVGCCPVSGNPLAGSFLTLRYRPAGCVLEVYALQAYLRRFVGGHPNGERNMEGMIQLICQDAAHALGVPVRARAVLVLDTGGMTVTACARPEA